MGKWEGDQREEKRTSHGKDWKKKKIPNITKPAQKT